MNYIEHLLRVTQRDVKKEERLLSSSLPSLEQRLDRIELDLEEIKELIRENIALTRIRRRKKGEPIIDTVEEKGELDHDVMALLALPVSELTGERSITHDQR